ncbi:MAG TPA: AAA family ATPase, partial [Chthoniobacterales bacterium]|nr:AAA family ATPase [Chthoniobacterales bacterium]
VGGIVAVVGEAGVGKSRLVSEALRQCASPIAQAEGRALSHTTGMSYWLAGDLLRRLVGCPENVSPDLLDRSLRDSLGNLKSLVFDQVYPYLATLLQLPLSETMQERVRFLSSEALQARILGAFRQYVSSRAIQQPLLIICEDVHWCDPSSLLLLKDLLPLVREFPLLILLAFRPEEETDELQQAAATAAGERFHLLKLSPLGRQQSGALVERLLQGTELPVKVRDLILNRAEGNPFFIEELLRSLLDSTASSTNDGRLTMRRELVETQVPETVQGVIAARMDRLSADRKEALQTAAVIGRVFQLAVLQNVLSTKQTDLDAVIVELCRLQFIQKRNQPAPNEEFVFKHAITHDVAYQTLLKARRKHVHQRVGETLERMFANRVIELAPTLGYHFERAELPDKAFRYLKSAGEHAQAVFANAEAEAYYRSAVRQGEAVVAGGDSEMARRLAEVEKALGDVLLLQGKNEDARAGYRRSLTHLPNDDLVSRSAIHRKIGLAYTVDRDYAAMGDAFDAAEKELGPHPVAPEEEWWSEKMQILLERLHLFYWQGMSAEMTQLAERYRSDIEQRGTPIQRGKFFQMLGLLELTRARYVASDKAVNLAELAVSTSRDSTDLAESAHIRFTAGLTHYFRGNLPEAIEHCSEALSLGERVGDLIMQTRCLAYLTVICRRSGDRERTRAFGDRTIAMAGPLGMVEYVAMAKANLAWLAWREERYAEARSLGEEALALWHGMTDPYGVDWQAILPLIAVAVAEQRLDDALRHAGELFGENQHPIPAPLAAAARDAIDAPPDPTITEPLVEKVIKVAVDIGYL